MSYLAQGLNGGFQAGYAAYNQNKRDKKQDEKDAARLKLEQDRMLEDIKQRGLDRTWRSDERVAGETFQDMQGEKSRGFQGTQAGFDRDHRTNLHLSDLDARAAETSAGRAFTSDENFKGRVHQSTLEQKRLSADATARQMANDLEKKKFDWNTSPLNPQNEYSRAAAGAMRTKAKNLGDLETEAEDPSMPTAPGKPAARTAEDEKMLKWARANKGTARADAILQMFGEN